MVHAHRACVTIVSGTDGVINPGTAHGILPSAVIALVSGGTTRPRRSERRVRACHDAASSFSTAMREHPSAEIVMLQTTLPVDVSQIPRPL
jgi:hypothetical protein